MRYQKITLGVLVTLTVLAAALVFATAAGADENHDTPVVPVVPTPTDTPTPTPTGVHVHGPHGQSDCTRTQLRLSIHKDEVAGIPGPPSGFAPYTWGAVTGDDNSWHVTLTGPAFQGPVTGTWAGQSVTTPSFAEGDEVCVPTPPPTTPPDTPPVTPPETPPVTPPETPPVTPPETPPVTPPVNTTPVAPPVELDLVTAERPALPTTGGIQDTLPVVGVLVLALGAFLARNSYRASRGLSIQ